MTTDRIVQYYTNNKSLVSQIRTDISMLGEKDVKLVEYAPEYFQPKLYFSFHKFTIYLEKYAPYFYLQ